LRDAHRYRHEASDLKYLADYYRAGLRELLERLLSLLGDRPKPHLNTTTEPERQHEN
jgi:hypothetical protein